MVDRALTHEIFVSFQGASSVRGFMEIHKNPNKKALLNSRVINPDPQNLVLQGSELLTLNGVEDFDRIRDLTDKKNARSVPPYAKPLSFPSHTSFFKKKGYGKENKKI